MKIHVFGFRMARDFIPSKPTLATRIFSSYKPVRYPTNLFSYHRYIKTLEYTFDDIDYDELRDRESMKHFYSNEGVLINGDVAKKMIEEFAKNYKNAQEWMVHCKEGISRSATVASAFNKIFGLGCDLESFTKNELVYDALINTAKKIL